MRYATLQIYNQLRASYFISCPFETLISKRAKSSAETSEGNLSLPQDTARGRQGQLS